MVEQHHVVDIFRFVVDDHRRTSLAKRLDNLCGLGPVAALARACETTRTSSYATGNLPRPAVRHVNPRLLGCHANGRGQQAHCPCRFHFSPRASQRWRISFLDIGTLVEGEGCTSTSSAECELVSGGITHS